MSFAQSPYDMVAYDDKAEYDVPADGTDLPQLLPVDEEEPGMSHSLVVSLHASWLLYCNFSLLGACRDRVVKILPYVRL